MYGEPWINCVLENIQSTNSPKISNQWNKQENRVVACINLLAHVSDEAPAFFPRKSDEVQLALAVLAGDHGAAAALADLVTEKGLVSNIAETNVLPVGSVFQCNGRRYCYMG